ncbi:MAG TPA: DUF4105 domain-containing protein [Mizugakiibacter sp.]|nr:DUF4105 domain-containing protein [Mizugakiibacter sp.]
MTAFFRGILQPWWWIVLLVFAAALPAHAGLATAPGSQLEVSLLTYGPGTVYWERFGHDAILLRDRLSGQAVTFNYGVFDFSQKHFLLNFIRGHMRYSMDANPAATDIANYVEAGRWIEQQRLTLTPAQRAKLRDFLLWNLQPAHRRYDYEYFTDNCSTRVRDALNFATDGAIKAQLSVHSSSLTFRNQTDRLLAPDPALMLLADLALGPYADQPLNAWQSTFIPMALMNSLENVQVTDATGHRQPLLSSQSRLYAGRLLPPPARAPQLAWPLGLAGLVLASLILLLTHSSRPILDRSGHWLAAIYIVLAGLAGTLMLLLWTLTAHQAAWGNENLLLFNPLQWLLLPALLKHPNQPSRYRPFARYLAAFLATVAMLALLARRLEWLPQQNLPWILLALPIALSLAWIMRGRTGRPETR